MKTSTGPVGRAPNLMLNCAGSPSDTSYVSRADYNPPFRLVNPRNAAWPLYTEGVATQTIGSISERVRSNKRRIVARIQLWLLTWEIGIGACSIAKPELAGAVPPDTTVVTPVGWESPIDRPRRRVEPIVGVYLGDIDNMWVTQSALVRMQSH